MWNGGGGGDAEAHRDWCSAGTVSPAEAHGTVVLGEECDDGNGTPGDGCSPTCHLE